MRKSNFYSTKLNTTSDYNINEIASSIVDLNSSVLSIKVHRIQFGIEILFSDKFRPKETINC